MRKNKIDFFIVGAPKCGTTSLYNYLKQNPKIFLPKIKELHYFAYPEVADTYYDVPFITDKDSYHEYFRGAKEFQKKGDISPSYLYNFKSAKRIFEYNPKAKIIMILRNPINRAISHYLMDVRIGYQDKELLSILTNPSKYPLFYKEYVDVGMYYEQVKMFQDIFPRENIKIYDFDDFERLPEGILEDINVFLEIKKYNYNVSQNYNTFALPKNKKLFYLIRNNSIFSFIYSITPFFIKEGIKQLFMDTTSKKPQMVKEKKILNNLFKEDITRLNYLIAFDVKRWIINA